MTSEKKPIIAPKKQKTYLNNQKKDGNIKTLSSPSISNNFRLNNNNNARVVSNISTGQKTRKAWSRTWVARTLQLQGSKEKIISNWQTNKKQEKVSWNTKKKETRQIVYSKWDKNNSKQKILQKFLVEAQKQKVPFQEKNIFWKYQRNIPDMISTFLAENNELSVNRKSPVNKNWTYDIWICQFNSYWQRKIIRDKNFYNEDFQVQKCVELWKNWTKFYWFNNRMKFKKYLIFK